MSDTTTTPAAFTAWRRRGNGPWRPVASAATEQEAWRKLLALPAEGHCDSAVLPKGKTPAGRTAGPPLLPPPKG